MASDSVVPVTVTRRGDHSGYKSPGRNRASSLPRSASLLELKAEALRCRTPQQFRDLLTHLQAFIPYKKLVGTWGYPSRTTIRYIFNQGFPTDLIRWHLTNGALWTSPAFQEWLLAKRAWLWCDAAERLKAQFDPELVRRVKQAGAQYSLCGGLASSARFVLFAAAMPSEQSGRAHLEQFEVIAPWLVQASQRAYPRALLTRRETAILERRATGEIAKQIAGAEGISVRTVRAHLESIKKKLYTDDLLNAVVIAMRSGMVLPPWTK